jgi:hypothetical protein
MSTTDSRASVKASPSNGAASTPDLTRQISDGRATVKG